MTNRIRSAAFTLVELLVVVAIIGVLAAVALPSFMRYVRKARTTEATTNVRRMFEGARAYYHLDWNSRGSTVTLSRQFPDSVAMTPAVRCCLGTGGKCVPAPSIWVDAWHDLRFAMDDSHYFQYQHTASGVEVDAKFSADAHGDLDCDGTFSTFEMTGWVLTDGTITSPAGQGGFYVNNALE